MPSVTSRTSAFPDSRRVIPSDHIVNVFGVQSRGLRTRYTWLHTHPLGYACRFTKVLAANLLWLGIGQFPAITHWVALSNFTKLLSDPKDLNLTRHEDVPFRITRSKTHLVLRDLMGHTDTKTTEIYLQAIGYDKRQLVMQAWGD